MVDAAHHVSCVTFAGDEVVGFLGDVLGMPVMDSMIVPEDVTGDFLAWPRPNPGATAEMIGKGSKGLVEVVRAPEEMRGRVGPGTAFITFAVTDLDDRLARSRERGYLTSEVKTFDVNPRVALSCATVTAGDLTFELVQFNAV
jgi:catechol 2,3-dioxygenase-like lactoylglutathione lyase family enzyme